MPEDLVLREHVRGFPDSPGVYLYRDKTGKILYVGKALSLKKRVASYFGSDKQKTTKTRKLMERVVTAEYILADDERQALLLENNLIKRHRPRYNILLRDDKSYPYLQITSAEKYPRVLITRKPEPDGSRYFGPYPNLKIRDLYKITRRFFGLCDCKRPQDGTAKKPCLRFQLRQCPGPCIGAVTVKEYAENVERLRLFLEGKHDPLTAYLKKEMEDLSDHQKYEEAARLRDLISSIVHLQKDYVVVTADNTDADAIALVSGIQKVLVSILQMRQGKVVGTVKLTLANEWDEPLSDVLPRFLEQYYVPGLFIPNEILIPQGMKAPSRWELWMKKDHVGPFRVHTPTQGWRLRLMKLSQRNALDAIKEETARAVLLNELGKALGMKRMPRSIACFDVSTLQGSQTVGSAIYFVDGVPASDRYRKFKIGKHTPVTEQGRVSAGHPDDFAAHQEMMIRYLELLEREGNPPPDLFLIDGGKGQLSAVEPVLQDQLKEGHGLASLAKREEEIFIPGRSTPVDLKGNEKVRHLLMRIRDEAHRFAIGYHRVIRDKQLVHSKLHEVAGLGKTRVETLLRRFGSVEGIKKATIEEISRIPRINAKLADLIKKTLDEPKKPIF